MGLSLRVYLAALALLGAFTWLFWKYKTSPIPFPRLDLGDIILGLLILGVIAEIWGRIPQLKEPPRLLSRVLLPLITGGITALLLLGHLDPVVKGWARWAIASLSGLTVLAAVGLVLNAEERPADAHSSRNGVAAVRSLRQQVFLWMGGGLLLALLLTPWMGMSSATRASLAGLLLLAPGYLLSSLLVAERLGFLGRIILSVALSMGLVPLPLVLLNALGVPFTLGGVLANAIFLTFLAALAVRYQQNIYVRLQSFMNLIKRSR